MVDYSSYASNTSTRSARLNISNNNELSLLVYTLVSVDVIYWRIDCISSNTTTSHYWSVAFPNDSSWQIDVWVSPLLLVYIYSSAILNLFYIAKVNTLRVDTSNTRLCWSYYDYTISDLPVPISDLMHKQVPNGITYFEPLGMINCLLIRSTCLAPLVRDWWLINDVCSIDRSLIDSSRTDGIIGVLLLALPH